MVSEEEDVVASHSTSPRQCCRRPASVLFLFLGTHFPLSLHGLMQAVWRGLGHLKYSPSQAPRVEAKHLRSWLAQDRSKTAVPAAPPLLHLLCNFLVLC